MKFKIRNNLIKRFSAAADKRGSGIMTTLITMVFMFSVASSLLMVTYTGMDIKVTYRGGVETRVYTEMYANEIQSTLELVCDKARRQAINDYLFNNPGERTPFSQFFMNRLIYYKYYADGDESDESKGEFLFTSSDGATIDGYVAEVLEKQMRQFAGYDGEGNTLNAGDDIVKITIDPNKVIGTRAGSEKDESGNPLEYHIGKTIFKSDSIEFQGIVVNVTSGQNGGVKKMQCSYKFDSAAYIRDSSKEAKRQRDKLNDNQEIDPIIKFSFVAGGSVIHTGNTSTKVIGGVYAGDELYLDNNQSLFELTASYDADDRHAHELVKNAHSGNDIELYFDPNYIFQNGIQVMGAKSINSYIVGTDYAGVGGRGYGLDTAAAAKYNVDNLGAFLSNDAADDSLLQNNTRLLVGESSNLWTSNITVHASSNAILNGYTYVANDLDLYGKKSNAVINYEYFGFGNGTKNRDDNYGIGVTDGANNSSAITVNGKNSHLDLTKTKKLELAGISFIKGQSKNIKSGESVNVKEEQRVYLVPINDMTYRSRVKDNNGNYTDQTSDPTMHFTSNPQVFSQKDAWKGIKASLDLDKVLWTKETKDGEGKVISSKKMTYESYNAEIEVLGENVGQKSVGYYFLSFKSSTDANNYFRDYFTYTNKQDIRQYLNNYLTVLHSDVYIKDEQVLPGSNTDDPLSGVVNTVGNFAYINNSGKLVLSAEISNKVRQNLGVDSGIYTKRFNNVCETLDFNVSGDGKNVIEKYVSTTNLTDTRLYRDADGLLLCITTDGDRCTVYKDGNKRYVKVEGGTSAPANPVEIPDEFALIISNGDVILNADFNGLIIANGNVTVGEHCATCIADYYSTSRALKLLGDTGIATQELETEAGQAEEAGEYTISNYFTVSDAKYVYE